MADVNSAVTGAGSGAAAGAAGGPVGAGVGGAVGLAASLLAPKRKINTPNLTPLINTANQGADKQVQLAQGLTSSLAPVNAQYKTDAMANSAGLKTDVAGLGKAYIDAQTKNAGDAATLASNTLKQNVLTAQPDIQRSLRESLSASGGLDRGAAPAAFARAGEAAANQIGQGEAAIQTEKLKAVNDATQKVFGANVDAVTTATGMDASTIQTLLNSGRQDLINEAQSIMQAERDRTSNLLGIQQNGNTQQLASETAGAAGENSLIQALLQSGGQALGGYIGSKGA